jgi:hypothetical protein
VKRLEATYRWNLLHGECFSRADRLVILQLLGLSLLDVRIKYNLLAILGLPLAQLADTS